MRKTYKFFGAAFLIIFSFLQVKALEHKDLFSRLAANNSKETAEIVEEMVQSGDPRYYPILNAVVENSLYTTQVETENSGLVIGISTGEEKEGETLYKLLKVFPQPAELTDKSGALIYLPLSKLNEINTGRRIRLMVTPVISTIQLYHWNPEKRKIAVKSVANIGTVNDVQKIESILKNEKNPDVVRAGKEAVYQLMLLSPEKAERIKAINELVANKGSDALNILTRHKEKETSEQVKAALNEAIVNVESRNNRIEIAQNLFTGLSLGSVLILMALGLAIIYGLMGIINMAHGEFMMIGAYTTFVVQGVFLNYLPASAFDYYFWIAMPLSFIVAGLFGVLIEFLVIRYLYNKPLESLLATWGVSLVLIQAARSVFGDLTSVKAPAFASGGFELVPQLTLPYNRLFIMALTVIVVIAVKLILSKTSFGLKIRAVTQNRNMSAALGVPTSKVNRYAFFLGTGIAGLGGWAITLVGNVVPNMGQTYIVDSFLVVVTGGVGKLIGTVFSGLGMGFMTKMLEPVFQAVYGKVLILILVILFLQIKPTGLFPAKGRSED